MTEIVRQYPSLVVAVCAFALVGATIAMFLWACASLMKAWTDLRKFYGEMRRERPESR